LGSYCPVRPRNMIRDIKDLIDLGL